MTKTERRIKEMGAVHSVQVEAYYGKNLRPVFEAYLSSGNPAHSGHGYTLKAAIKALHKAWRRNR